MTVTHHFVFFTFLRLAKYVLAFDRRVCFTSALQRDKSSHDQCSCDKSEGPVTTLSTSAHGTTTASLAIAQPTQSTSSASSRLYVDALGAKRGFAYNDATLVNKFTHNVPCTKCSWAYNWDSFNNGLDHSLNLVPMLWSPDAELWTCDDLGCVYDFCVAHWYGKSVESLLQHVAAVREICRGKPVWLTEFALDVGRNEQHAAFITAVVPRLDAVDYLERYAYFMVQEGRFVSGSTITSSSQAYAEA